MFDPIHLHPKAGFYLLLLDILGVIAAFPSNGE